MSLNIMEISLYNVLLEIFSAYSRIVFSNFSLAHGHRTVNFCHRNNADPYLFWDSQFRLTIFTYLYGS